MRYSFKNADFSALTDLWNDFYPPQYAIDRELFKLKTVESPVFDWGASIYEADGGRVAGFVAVKRSATPALYPGGDPDQAHLSAIAFAEPQVGLDILAETKALLRNRGVGVLSFGQDSDHFFPGCPEDHRALCSFLMVEGFEATSEPCDFERDLSDYEFKGKLPKEAEVRPLAEGEIGELDAHLEKEFSPRWRYDVLRKAAVEGPDCVAGLLLAGKLEGFCLLQSEPSKCPIGGAVWRLSLGEHWGALGPIGVSKSVRGQGLGAALLGHSLLIQKKRGVRRCIIDWTNLAEFYGKQGFKVARRYSELKLKLD